MKVLKFGGTSVGSPVRMKKVAGLVTKNSEPKVVVLSAVSGTTNRLIEMADTAGKGGVMEAESKLEALKEEYFDFITGLLGSSPFIKSAQQFIEESFQRMDSILKNRERLDKEIPAFGELISTQLFTYYLQEQGIRAILLPALDFMKIDEEEEPDMDFICKSIQAIMKGAGEASLYVTQGYICKNHRGEVDNLKRGGSDYSASLIGAALEAEEVQIWTDIDGMHNNDPRVVKNTYPLSELSFDEAAELAYFGAKILHPSTIRPAQKYNIPVRLKSTMDDKAPGTIIQQASETGKVKAIAAKDHITAIKIKSSRMLLAYGFMRKVFEIFERQKTSIDMITTSEVAVSLTIDNDSQLNEIRQELVKFGKVEIDSDQSIICIVGDCITEDIGVLKNIFAALVDIPIRMVSYGGSRYNISLLIDTKYKEKALNSLNVFVFTP